MKSIIKNIPLLTMCFLYFGFCNLYYYFNEFKIDIYNYINNSEIILSFFPVIVVTASVLYGFFYQWVIKETTSKNIPEKIENINQSEKKTEKESYWKRIMKDGTFVALLYYLLILAISLGLQKIFHIKTYNLQSYNIITAVLFCVLIIYYIYKHENVERMKNNSLIFSLCFVIYIGNQISTYRQNDALKIKDGIALKNIRFKYNNSLISTSNNLLYIGQTQSSIFLYNRLDYSTIVLQLSKVDSLIIK